jgi:D-glycero-alpha-D-manno-heptose-7-phosphate kinase
MMAINSRAPTRISFAGGGTDVEPFTSEYGGAVLNAAVAKYNYTTILPSQKTVIKSLEFLSGIEVDKDNIVYDRKMDLLKAAIKVLLERPAEISVFSEVQYRSGLGSSGSAFVSVISAIAAYCGKSYTKAEKAELAWKIERDELGNMGGKQDQYAAAYGGFNFLEFRGRSVSVKPLRLNREVILELEKRVILSHVSQRERSGRIIEEQTKNVMEKRKDTIDALLRSRELAREMRKALIGRNIEGAGLLLKEAWAEKKKFTASITNEYVDRVYEGALKKGALSGKISGAGGGGYMFFIALENREIELFTYLRDAGLNPEFVKFDYSGSTVWEL